MTHLLLSVPPRRRRRRCRQRRGRRRRSPSRAKDEGLPALMAKAVHIRAVAMVVGCVLWRDVDVLARAFLDAPLANPLASDLELAAMWLHGPEHPATSRPTRPCNDAPCLEPKKLQQVCDSRTTNQGMLLELEIPTSTS